MMRLERRLAIAALAAALVTTSASPAQAQATPPMPAKPAASAAAPAPSRFRLVLNASFWPAKTSFSDSQAFTEYAEQTTIRTSYEAGTGFGPDAALQVSLFRGLGLLVGYSHASGDVTGQVDVSRPHPLHLNRNRSASSELSGYGLTEGALHLDLAYARAAGHLDWALFAGATLFQVEADLLGKPTATRPTPTMSCPSQRPRRRRSSRARPASTWAAGSTTASAAPGGSAPASRSSTARRA